MERRAHVAEAAHDGNLLCLQTFDDELELWSVANDTQIRRDTVSGISDLRASRVGCLVSASKEGGDRAQLYNRDGPAKTLTTEGNITAISANHEELLVAASDQIFAFNFDGVRTAQFDAAVGITAIQRINAEKLAVGYDNGNIELLTITPTPGSAPWPSQSSHSFSQTPSSRVNRLILGPMNTLVAGFDNGTVGLWSWPGGKRLSKSSVHGPIKHLMMEHQQLYAASSLGQHLVWDLSALYAEHCDLLHDVWEQVPVVWKDARAVKAQPPSNHACKTSVAP